MDTTLDIYTNITEKNLEEAENRLVAFASTIDKNTQIQDPRVAAVLAEISTQLNRNNAEKRKEVGAKIQKHSRNLTQLIKNTNQLHKECLEIVRTIFNDNEKEKVSLNEVERWKTRWDMELERKLASNQNHKSTLNDELAKKLSEKKRLQQKLEDQTVYISELKKADKSLHAPDRTTALHQEIKQMEVKVKQLIHRASIIAKQKFNTPKDLNRCLAELKNELDLYENQIHDIDTLLPNSILVRDKSFKPKKKKQKAKEVKEFEKLISDVRKEIKEKNDLLMDMIIIEEDLKKTNQDLAETRILAEGETNRVRKQEERANWIAENLSIKEDLESDLENLLKAIEQIRLDIRHCDDNHADFLSERERKEQLIESLKQKDNQINQNVVQIRKMEKREKSTQSPKELWIENLKERIAFARKHINLGNPLLVLLLPQKAFARYQAGRIIRRELILLEREFRQLGLLNRNYLEGVDIFNRRTKNGLQLSLDVLNCR